MALQGGAGRVLAAISVVYKVHCDMRLSLGNSAVPQAAGRPQLWQNWHTTILVAK